MDALFQRAAPLLGEGAKEALIAAHIAVFGLGGVGGACAEALCRAGVGHITLIDGDRVEASDLNRQIGALTSTLGTPKAQVFAARARDINPAVDARAVVAYYGENNPLSLAEFDFVADAIDDVPAKVLLIENAKSARVPLISAMGAAGKLDGSLFRIADIAETFGCPLAKKMRKELKARGVASLPVVFSPEPARVSANPPASVSSVPPVPGFLMAGYIVRTLLSMSL